MKTKPVGRVGYSDVVHDATYRRVSFPWRSKFRVQYDMILGPRFATEEEAARWSDVARQFLLGNNVEINLDGDPPRGWTKTDVLAWLFQHGFLTQSDLARIVKNNQDIG